jgi:hypothetical protein
MNAIKISDLVFVVKEDEAEGLRQFPDEGYYSLGDAAKARNNAGRGYVVKSYIYLWNVIQRNVASDWYTRQMNSRY